MRYKIQETDEILEDITQIAISRYDYTGDIESAESFIDEYSSTIQTLEYFPNGYRGISIEHRGYEIKLMPWNYYNIFFIIRVIKKEIVILRLLNQKQDWATILRFNDFYHLNNKEL